MMGDREGGEGRREAIRLRSAGGVVTVGEGAGLRVALMRSTYGTWVFPKGGVERGETCEEAARREVEEEIGLSGLTTEGDLGWTEHEFEREGQRYRKRVDWFLFGVSEQEDLRADPTENVVDCGWFEAERALSVLSHASQRRILRKALARVGRLRLGADGTGGLGMSCRGR